MLLFVFLLLSTSAIQNDEANDLSELKITHFSPLKGSKDGGFQIFVEVENSKRHPMWIKIDDSIITATIEDDGRYSIWSPQHEKGKVEIEISKDGINWYRAGVIEYTNDYSLQIVILFIICGAILSTITQYVKKYIRKNFKARKSDDGEMKQLLSRPLRGQNIDPLKNTNEIL